MKEIFCHCGLKLNNDPRSFTDDDGVYILPVIFAPTIKDLEKFYKKEMGDTYKKTTGENAKYCFEKVMCELTHINYEDADKDEREKHSFGKVECWTDMP